MPPATTSGGAARTSSAFRRDWQTLKFRQREIEFAWGPTPDRALRRSAAIELVIASGSGAGKGSVCFDRLELRELPASELQPAPTATATSTLSGHDAANAVDGRAASDWQPAESRAAAATLTVDYGVPREFGVLALRWRRGAAASRYAIALSDDGERWREVRRVDRARGELQSHWLPDSEARFVRISVDEPAGKVVALAELELRPPVEANAFFAELAKAAPRGRYPRSYLGQQSYWTVLGVDGGRTASLFSEDAVLEPVPGVGALEPFLIVDGKVLGWADVRSSHTLQGGDLPMPSVHWRAGDLALDTSAFGDGTPDAAQALARYRVRNLGKEARRVTLALAWRPFQANPPTQFLAHPGGASAIDALDWDGRVLRVNGVPRLRALVAPSAVRLEPLAAGPVGDWLGEPGSPPAPVHLADPAGFASAALLFDLSLDAGEEREVTVALPVEGAAIAPAPADVAAAEARAVAHWRARLDRVRISGPAEVEEIARTLRSSLGHILVNRSAAAIQPGPRAYARSWIRDGALTSSALLRLGQDDVGARLPALVRAVPVRERQGAVLRRRPRRRPGARERQRRRIRLRCRRPLAVTRATQRRAQLWPHVRRAVAHMDALRRSERTAANLAPAIAAPTSA